MAQWKRRLTGCIAAAVVGIGLTGCGAKPSAGSAPAPDTAAKTVTVKGSDTMVHLVDAWADAFGKAHPDAKISVTGGGSGTGIAALMNGTTDICASSRDLNGEERKSAEAKGLTLMESTVAQDALSIVVNPKNTVGELTLDQIAQIYTGAVTNWKDVGGPDETIVVASRESSSGTYMFFQEHVLKKKDYASGALLLPATSAIVQTVADSAGAIGYVGLGYAAEAKDKVKTIGVKPSADAPAVMPSAETVLNRSYSIARPLFLIVSKEPAGTIKAFLDFCASPDGQKIVEANGYVTVK
ncbi:MAG: PstS family phosphate ABC transporter substrate-binding protein [Candidatus Hydrogenedentes bacterium]|nr:PstS family phosphate ABC transporter substrate-binding protein [Candidatus Hydrogenedentota bacterium]